MTDYSFGMLFLKKDIDIVKCYCADHSYIIENNDKWCIYVYRSIRADIIPNNIDEISKQIPVLLFQVFEKGFKFQVLHNGTKKLTIDYLNPKVYFDIVFNKIAQEKDVDDFFDKKVVQRLNFYTTEWLSNKDNTAFLKPNFDNISKQPLEVFGLSDFYFNEFNNNFTLDFYIQNAIKKQNPDILSNFYKSLQIEPIEWTSYEFVYTHEDAYQIL